MIIEDLAKMKANSIPNSKLVKYYEAAIPQYHMETILTMLKEKKLSVLQEFVLKFASVGINDINEIRNFLGVNQTAINNAVAILQKDDMISVNIYMSNIKLTQKGETALKEAAMIVPEDVEYAVYVDGLIGNIYLDTKRLYSQKDIKNFGLTPVVPVIDKPAIEYLEFEEVKRAVNIFKKNHEYERDKLGGELQEVSRVEKTYVEYKKVFVLVYMNEKTKDLELHAYEGITQNDEYGIELQKMHNSNTRVVNFDIKNESDDEEERPILNSLPKEIIDNAKAYSYKNSIIEREISNLTTELNDIKEGSQYEDDEIKETSTERIRFLEKKLAEMEDEKKGADRILSTYDHRPLLINALENAQRSIIIISPWIKSGGLDNQILNLIDKAVQRNTKVIIGYGISQKKDSDKWILDRLNGIQSKKFGKNLVIIALNNTHEKVLIKDNDFMVITSFNWLSFKGDFQKGFRQETGYYTESKEAISQMKQNLSQGQRLGINL